ncbi:coniferyl-aldehyde dehydrogenase, partial [Pseudoalteromonas sp. S1731]
MDTDSTHTPSLSDTFNELQNSCLAQSFLPIDKRIVLFKTLHKRNVSNEKAIIDAASQDFGYRTAVDTLLGDILPTRQGLAHNIKKLPKWATPSKRNTSLS